MLDGLLVGFDALLDVPYLHFQVLVLIGDYSVLSLYFALLFQFALQVLDLLVGSFQLGLLDIRTSGSVLRLVLRIHSFPLWTVVFPL